MKMALANLTLVLVALGLIAFVVSIVLAIMKKIKWRYPPIILVVTLVVLVVAVEAIGPIDESKSADVRVGKLVYSKGDKEDGSSWARYVTKVTYKDKHITVHLNSNVYALNRKALDNLARMSQGMALAVLDEDDEISDSKASEGMSTQWKVGDDIVGYTGLGNYHNYKWNI